MPSDAKKLIFWIIVALLLADSLAQFIRTVRPIRRKNAKDLHIGNHKRKNHTLIEDCEENCTKLYPRKKQVALLQTCKTACHPQLTVLEQIWSVWSIFGCLIFFLLYKVARLIFPPITVKSTAVSEHLMMMSKQKSASKIKQSELKRASFGRWELDYEQHADHDISMPFTFTLQQYAGHPMLYHADFESRDRKTQSSWKGKAYISFTQSKVKLWLEKQMKNGAKFAYEGILIGDGYEGIWRHIGTSRGSGTFSLHRVKEQ